MNDGFLLSKPRALDAAQDTISVGEIFAVLWRRRLWLLLAVLAGGLIGFYEAEVRTVPEYRATAVIALEPESARIPGLTDFVTEARADVATLNTERQVFRGRTLLARVVEDLDLINTAEFGRGFEPGDPTDPQAAAIQLRAVEETVSALQRRTEVTNPADSRIYEVSVTSLDAERAAQLANAIAGEYIELDIERKRAQIDRALEWLNSRATELRGELASVTQGITTFQADRSSAPQSENFSALEQLTSEADSIRELHRYVLNQIQQTSVQKGFQTSRAKMLSPAIVPFQPTGPGTTSIVLVGAVAGLTLGLILIAVVEGYRPKAVRSAAQLAPLLGRVMAQVPRLSRREQRRARKGEMISDPIFLEAINDLRAAVPITDVDRSAIVISVVSCAPGDGKTTTALSLADSFGRSGLKVLLIDGDLRRRSLSRWAGLAEQTNIEDVLEDRRPLGEAVTRRDKFAAHVLGGGRARRHAQELTSGTHIKTLIEQGRAHYDVIVIDTPPLAVVSDAIAFVRESQAAVFVVRTGKTTEQDLANATGKLKATASGTPILPILTHVPKTKAAEKTYYAYLSPS